LIDKHLKLQKKMLETQAAYVIAARAGNVSDAKLRKMADKGYKAELETFKAGDEIKAFAKKYKISLNKIKRAARSVRRD